MRYRIEDWVIKALVVGFCVLLALASFAWHEHLKQECVSHGGSWYQMGKMSWCEWGDE